MDFSLGYDLPVGVDRFSFQLSGTFLFEKYNRVTPASPLVRAFNTVFTPADLKLRNRLGWTRNGFSASLFINYVDNYRDVRPGWEGPVSSWTTVDLTMRYRFSDGWTKGMTLSLSALNLMDEDPPFVRNNGFDFDATNASGVGRYVSIGVSKEW